jgi:hypothetical protein
MRLLCALIAVAGLAVAAGDVAPVLASGDAGSVLAMVQQPGQYEVDIDVDGAGGAWWANPFWIGAGIVGLILLIVIIALATRGGGTTVIKE